MTTYSLTPKQIKEIDEIMLDKDVTNRTLNVALNYHSNRMNAITKKEKGWWDEAMSIFNLSKDRKYKVKFDKAVICIEEVDEEEDDV